MHCRASQRRFFLRFIKKKKKKIQRRELIHNRKFRRKPFFFFFFLDGNPLFYFYLTFWVGSKTDRRENFTERLSLLLFFLIGLEKNLYRNFLGKRKRIGIWDVRKTFSVVSSNSKPEFSPLKQSFLHDGFKGSTLHHPSSAFLLRPIWGP